jgi:diguanylate cyclase (GGDEF)-like protein
MPSCEAPKWEDLNEAFREVLEHLAGAVHTRTLFVAEIRDELFRFVQVWRDGRDRSLEGKVLPLEEVYCRDVVRGDPRPLCLPDTSTHPLGARNAEGGTRAYLGVPITLSDGSVYGTLCATEETPYPFSEEELRVMNLAARFLGLIIDMNRLMIRDALTGVYNRNFIEYGLYAEQMDLGEAWGILLLDCDGFKGVNDTYGHCSGDQALRLMARRILEAVRPEDVVVRLGGDEFLVVLPQLDARRSALRSVARAVEAAFRQPFRVHGRHLSLHVSAGAAARPDDGTALEELLRAADRLLYRAKAARARARDASPVEVGG